ncbi:unnamed protein product [Fusarium venenatum]|uniref:Uncharacterized protein n=1 Tax=Fusarium venenatum TaxID=56646 RepID=A0A2L2TKL8_9HYPO|nr:uncharacterized protein FVRRES_08750 [Fusarium venenatum]CEI68673.1 unnamed protein product [Fusarium venenatum]
MPARELSSSPVNFEMFHSLRASLIPGAVHPLQYIEIPSSGNANTSRNCCAYSGRGALVLFGLIPDYATKSWLPYLYADVCPFRKAMLAR